jgi:hypothetical protein
MLTLVKLRTLTSMTYGLVLCRSIFFEAPQATPQGLYRTFHCPVIIEDPVIIDDSVIIDDPVIIEDPEDDPVIEDDPIIIDDPVIEDDPIIIEDPVIIEDPGTRSESSPLLIQIFGPIGPAYFSQFLANNPLSTTLVDVASILADVPDISNFSITRPTLPTLEITLNDTPENPVLIGTAEPDSIIGTNEADFIQGLGSNDQILSLDGNDTLHGNQGDDFIDAGPGDDLVHGGWLTDKSQECGLKALQVGIFSPGVEKGGASVLSLDTTQNPERHE